jgi:hypothetical protein
MKPAAYKLENSSPLHDNDRVDIERYVIEARLRHDAYTAELIVRGVRRLSKWFDNGIVKPVRNWKGDVTDKVLS